MRIKIGGGIVVPVDAAMSAWNPGYVIVDGGTILDAGPGPGPAGRFDAVHDASGMVVIPGLINAHAHSPSNLFKGTWSRLPLEIWRQYIRAAWRELSDETIYVSTQLGAVEMLKTGCTAVLDHFYSGSPSPYMGALHAVRAMDDAGMRGAVALTLSDRPYEETVPLPAGLLSEEARREAAEITRLETASTLDACAEFIQEVRSVSRNVVPMVGPSAPHRCTDTLLRGCVDLAERMDIPVHIHVAETRGQYLQGVKLYGTSLAGHLDDIGMLGERLSMAHCVWLTRKDMRRVARRGATAIHNPASNGKLGSGRMRLDEMLELDVRVALATDGSGSNDTQNMFEAMRLAGLLHNRNDKDYLAWPAPEAVLRAATVNGAYAIGLGGKVGAIATGWAADLVLLTTETYHLTPLNNVANQLVYCENGISVRDVMVEGRWVVRDGKVLAVDEAALYRRARDLRAEVEDRLRSQFRRTAALEPALRAMYLEVARTPWTDEPGTPSPLEGEGRVNPLKHL